MPNLSVLSDSVSLASVKRAGADWLKFQRYVDPLLSIFADPQTETPFTIGVFGTWGSGKSTLLSMLCERLEEKHPAKFVRVWFNPWNHRREPNMLVPLLHALHDTLANETPFKKSAKKIAEILLRLGADVLLKAITADVVSVEKLEKIEKSYLREKSKVESEIRNLRRTLQQEMDVIANDGAKVVIFIDDLDRCEPDELIGVLEATKLFLDLRNVFFVLAMDKEVIDRAISIRYDKFDFAKERRPAIGAEYLEKMIQLPLHLFPIHPTQITGFIEDACKAMRAPETIRAQIPLIAGACLPNPRKIKRVLNALSVTMTMASHLQFDPGILTRLALIQVQHGVLYADVVRCPDLLVALQRAYNRTLNVERDEQFDDFGDRRAIVQPLAKGHYQPGSWMETIFKDATFEASRQLLPAYLSLLGG